jgi:hypothetical protein
MSLYPVGSWLGVVLKHLDVKKKDDTQLQRLTLGSWGSRFRPLSCGNMVTHWSVGG